MGGEGEIWVRDFRRGTERHLEDLSVDAAVSSSIKNGIEVHRLDIFVQVRVRCQFVVTVVREFSVLWMAGRLLIQGC